MSVRFLWNLVVGVLYKMQSSKRINRFIKSYCVSVKMSPYLAYFSPDFGEIKWRTSPLDSFRKLWFSWCSETHNLLSSV